MGGERAITTVDRAMRPDEEGLPKPTCPRCGSEGTFPIAYGVPTFEMVEETLAGRVEWGGCVAWPESPEWGCLACGHDWRGYRAG